MRLPFLIPLLFVLLPPASGPAAPDGGTVTGSVIVVEGTPLKNQKDVWVYLVRWPQQRKQTFGKQKQVIVQKNQEFTPKVRVIPVGSTIGFPNEDLDLHNVFSPTDPVFDLGTYPKGLGKERVFHDAGEFDIFCDVHSKMNAKVKVVESEWIAQVKDDTFTIRNVPPGTYKAVAWMPDSKDVRSATITVTAGGTVTLAVPLHLQKGKPKPHLRKDGSQYPPYK